MEEFDIFSSLIIGVVSGFISSFVYFMFLRALKPKIMVSPSITLLDKGSSYEYIIKVVNKSRSDLIDVFYSFQIYTISPDNIVDTNYIEPTKKILRHIEKYKKSDNNTYAVRFSFTDNKKRALDDSSFLVFTIYATHAFSGRSIVIRTKYKNDQIIKNGLFETGTSVKILQHHNKSSVNSV